MKVYGSVRVYIHKKQNLFLMFVEMMIPRGFIAEAGEQIDSKH